MSADLSYFALFLAGLTVLGLALAPWMARVFDGRVTLLAPVERALYRAAGVTGAGQRWTGYLAIPAAFPFLFGRMVGDRRQGWAIYAAMAALFVGVLLWAYFAEAAGNPLHAGITQAGVSMEGKETRFGLAGTVLFEVVTTVASCGAVNAMHDSLMALGGMIPLFNMLLGEIIFGGVGAGFYGMVLYVVLTVFLAGLMVGRTPEWLGKKIEAREMKLAALTLLVMPLGVLVLSAASILTGNAQSAVQDAGPHGLTELIYAYTSGTANNGSAFAGFGANTVWHNTLIGLAMLIGRWGYIIPVLAIAGSLAGKTRAEATAGTFPTHGVAFTVLLVVTILIVGALTFLPVLALGPIAEHVSIAAGQSF